jgi:hypothetical protein
MGIAVAMASVVVGALYWYDKDPDGKIEINIEIY